MASRRLFLLGCLFVYCCMLAYDAVIFENVNIGADIYQTFKIEGWNIYSKEPYHFNHSVLKIRESKPKVILLWRPFFGVAIQEQHACRGCVLTHDRSVAGEADAIVFHCADLRDSRSSLPQIRAPWQRYVWACMEPPGNVRFTFQKLLTEMDNVFNWTMTYRTDSDILMSYAILWDPVNKTVAEITANKNATELVVWAVSNCHAEARMKYANELALHVSVDYYGKCYGKTTGLNIARYKFYLAFENSHCKDYITEKFWSQALSSFTVPIVMGTTREDYEKVAPPHSFIHVDDFDSPKELAAYLIKLNNDDKLYSEYLRWRSLPDSGYGNWKTDISANPKLKGAAYKRIVDSVQDSPNSMCRLCNKLKNEPPGNTVDVIEKLDQWWYGKSYTSSSSEFPICSKHSGPSGLPLRPYVTFAYSFLFFLFAGIIFWCVFYKRKHTKDRTLL